ncbi:MAG: alpha/beta hydrolase [Deltaproteobacteria bacterium]|nr:alpha/beta hydrolase [Deltaproteobacteria bacterium]
MKIEKIHPELRNTVRFILPFPRNRTIIAILNMLLNLAPRKSIINGVKITDVQLEKTNVRLYRPEGKLSGAGLLWIHGGGFITGRAFINDKLCAAYSKDLNLVVVSVDYRLAPEFPFPAALDDCFEAWQWFQNEASNMGVDPRRIAISGQSSGGCLAASLAQKIYDEKGVQPAAQALFCPALDDRTAANYELDTINHRIWNNKSNRAGWSAYLGHDPGKSEVPEYAVPARRENLSGLPPAWISVGEVELFYEEACLYCERLKENGVSCHLHISPMAPHGFEAFVPKASLTHELFNANYHFLRETLKLTK